MKNLLLILVLANILYYVWGLNSEAEPAPGVEILKESDMGPALTVATDRSGESVASVGAVLGSGEPSALDAVTGPSCVSIGPFLDDGDADSALLEYSNDGLRTARRSRREDTFVGHWVQIRDVATEATAKTMVKTLHDGGLPDAYTVVTDDEGIKISLGLFGDVDGAEKIELQARSLNLPAEISPRMAERTVFYVDIGLPPGRGAGEIVSRYGEDRVRLRSEATCPK